MLSVSIKVINLKKPKVLAGFLLLLFFAVVLYLYVLRDTEYYPPPQTDEQISEAVKRDEVYDSLIKQVNTASDETTLSMLQSFASDSQNNLVSRLNSVRLCILVAKELNKEQNASDCYNLGRDLTGGFAQVEDIQAWLTYLQEAYSGENVSTEGITENETQ